MQRIKLRFETGLRQYYKIPKILPKDRLEDEEKKFERNHKLNLDYHPLIKLLHDAKIDLDEGDKFNTEKITTTLAKLIILGLDIELLQEKKITGANEKISELISADYQKFDNVIYEIRVASYLIKKDHKVEFLKEGKTPTTDLLINNEVQLDCKKKDHPTKQDQFNYDYFNKNWSGVLDQLNSNQKYCLVYVHFKRIDKIDENLGEKAKSKVLEQIEIGKEGKFTFDDFTIYIYNICKNKDDIINSKLPYIDKSKIDIHNSYSALDAAFRQRINPLEYADILRRGISFCDYGCGLGNLNGMSGMKEIHAVLCATKKLPERFSSIIDAINYANNQISEKTPGIVSISIVDLTAGMFPFDYQQVAVLSEDALKLNRRVSAAVFTSEEFNKDSKEYSFGAQMLKNNNANLKFSDLYDNLICL